MSLDLKRDKASGNSLGYGFVSLRSYGEAEAARRALHKSTSSNHNAVRVNWAHKNTSLFVSNTSGMDSKTLRERFSEFGSVISEETFVRGDCGYIRYADRRSAEKAKQTLDGTMINGEIVQVRHRRRFFSLVT